MHGASMPAPWAQQLPNSGSGSDLDSGGEEKEGADVGSGSDAAADGAPPSAPLPAWLQAMPPPPAAPLPGSSTANGGHAEKDHQLSLLWALASQQEPQARQQPLRPLARPASASCIEQLQRSLLGDAAAGPPAPSPPLQAPQPAAPPRQAQPQQADVLSSLLSSFNSVPATDRQQMAQLLQQLARELEQQSRLAVNAALQHHAQAQAPSPFSLPAPPPPQQQPQQPQQQPHGAPSPFQGNLLRSGSLGAELSGRSAAAPPAKDAARAQPLQLLQELLGSGRQGSSSLAAALATAASAGGASGELSSLQLPAHVLDQLHQVAAQEQRC